MVFFLKEAVLLMIVATTLSFPSTPLVEQPPPVTKEGDEEEVYPKISTKNVSLHAKNDQAHRDEAEDDFALEESRKAFRVKRGAVDRDRRWKNIGGHVTVYYGLDGVNDKTERWLKDIFRELELKTCVRFRKQENPENYVKFVKGSGACKSDIGRKEGKRNYKVSIWNPGCDYRGTIMHEVLHLLGFEHEHQRFDRDQYINVYRENVQTEPVDLWPQFKIKSQDVLAPYNAYDEHSIMQYNEYAFSKEDGVKKTMEAKDGKKLGELSHMDANDIMKVNKLCECPTKRYKDYKVTLKTANSFLAGTDGDVYLKLIGGGGAETDFELVTEGGMIADENERGAEENHNMAFLDVGSISAVEVALVNEGSLPSTKRKRSIEREMGETKRWNNGWTLEYVKLQSPDGSTMTFPGGDFGIGDTKRLNPTSKK